MSKIFLIGVVCTLVLLLSTPVTFADTLEPTILAIGDTWDLGNGITINVRSIDAIATPKQVWLILSDNGVKLEDKVLSEGENYNYNTLFVTTVADIWQGATTDYIKLTDTSSSRFLPKGSISVSSSPSGASIYLDGTYKGTTPTVLYNIPVGWHTIKLTKSEHEDKTKTINVLSGKSVQISETFNQYDYAIADEEEYPLTSDEIRLGSVYIETMDFIVMSGFGLFIIIILISSLKRKESSRKKNETLSKWKLYLLGIMHCVVLIIGFLGLDLLVGLSSSYSNHQKLIGILYIAIGVATTIILYNIFKYGRFEKKLPYLNIILLMGIVGVFFWFNSSEVSRFTIINMLLSIPSLANIIIITKYGKYPIKGSTSYEQTHVDKISETKDGAPNKNNQKLESFNTKTNQNPIETKQSVVPDTLGESVQIKTAFGYKGAAIIFKLKIENNTSDPISDIKIYPYVPDVFLLKEKDKSISLIEPNSSQTVTFEIRPTGECGDCNISGRVNYYDMVSRKRQDIELEPKSLSIVCPMLHGKEISEDEWHDAVGNLVKTEESTREIDMPAESLFKMVSRIVKDMHMYMQKPEITDNQQLFNGVARFYAEGVKGLKYAAQVEVVGGAKKSKLILKVWAEKEDALTGFYHGVLDEIEKRVNVKEYIQDSIVQQYNIHYGDKIGTQVKDSVVQRSNIGAGVKRKCPDCGKETGDNEKFCNECGTKL